MVLYHRTEHGSFLEQKACLHRYTLRHSCNAHDSVEKKKKHTVACHEFHSFIVWFVFETTCFWKACNAALKTFAFCQLPCNLIALISPFLWHWWSQLGMKKTEWILWRGGGQGFVMVRGGVGLWYSPIAELCSVACNFLLVANYELSSPPTPYPASHRLSLGRLIDRKWDLNAAPAGRCSVLTEVTDKDGGRDITATSGDGNKQKVKTLTTIRTIRLFIFYMIMHYCRPNREHSNIWNFIFVNKNNFSKILCHFSVTRWRQYLVNNGPNRVTFVLTN
jgi:hypothetical protein